MHIQYAYVDLKPANNLPRRNGDGISAGNYAEDIVRGFSVSYRFALENRSLLKQRCRILEDAVSRVMVRNTQQYTMYLAGSFHPDFLSEKNGREEIFGRHFAEGMYFEECRLWNGIDPASANRYSDRHIKQEYSVMQLLEYYRQGLELQSRIAELYHKRRG